MKTRRHGRKSLHKRKFSKSVRNRNKSKRRSKSVLVRNNKTKKLYKKRNFSYVYRGGNGAQYPAVYGITNKSVLYPISPNGITVGLPDPPIPSNGPFGNGPVGRDIVSGNMLGGGSQSTLAPQSLVNLTRSLTGGVNEVLNGFGGYKNSDSLNPMPYAQPINQDIKYIRTNYPDLGKSYNNADNYVSNL